MPKYIVRVPYCVWVNIELDAEDRDDAVQQSLEYAGLSGFCGNGGSNKLVGVTAENVSVEACECPLDFEGVCMEVEEV